MSRTVIKKHELPGARVQATGSNLPGMEMESQAVPFRFPAVEDAEKRMRGIDEKGSSSDVRFLWGDPDAVERTESPAEKVDSEADADCGGNDGVDTGSAGDSNSIALKNGHGSLPEKDGIADRSGGDDPGAARGSGKDGVNPTVGRQKERERTKAAALTAAVLIEAQNKGYREGLARAEAEAKVLLARANAALERLRALAAELKASASTDAVRLASEIARRILERELEIQPDEVVEIARRAVGKLGGKQVKVHANPADVELLMPRVSEMQAGEDGLKIRVMADEAVPRGGVVVESELGLADARIDTQVDQLVEAAFAKGGIVADGQEGT